MKEKCNKYIDKKITKKLNYINNYNNYTSPVIKENTTRMVASCQNNVLLLWCPILNCTPYYGV